MPYATKHQGGSVIVYFANRPRMAIFATNSWLDATEGLLKRFV